jgi:hypothetical protein
MLSTSASTSSRLLKKAAHCVLGRPSPCDVPQGYASVAALPAALLSAFLSSLPELMQFPLFCKQSLLGPRFSGEVRSEPWHTQQGHA